MNTFLFTDEVNQNLEIVLNSVFPNIKKFFFNSNKENQHYIELSGSDLVLIATKNRSLTTNLIKKVLDAGSKVKMPIALDFIEDDLPPSFIIKLALYGLEIKFKESVRERTKFILRNDLSDFKSIQGIYSDVFSTAQDEAVFYLNCLRLFNSYENKQMEVFLTQLKLFDTNKSKVFDFVIFKTIEQTKLFSENLVNYNNLNRFLHDKNEYLLISLKLMELIYRRIKNAIFKINNFVGSLLVLISKLDHDGRYIKIVETIIENDKSSGKIHEYVVLMYAEVYNNTYYINQIGKVIKEPTNRVEEYYHSVVIKTQQLIANQKANLSKNNLNELASAVSFYLSKSLSNTEDGMAKENEFYNILSVDL
jgi:hypothetical protein